MFVLRDQVTLLPPPLALLGRRGAHSLPSGGRRGRGGARAVAGTTAVDGGRGPGASPWRPAAALPPHAVGRGRAGRAAAEGGRGEPEREGGRMEEGGRGEREGGREEKAPLR